LPGPHLSVVIPAFNEATRIIPTLEDVVQYLQGRPYLWEVIVVDDGSDDETGQLVDDWSADHPGVKLVRVPHKGKGWAVKQGMLAAEGLYAFMCDADGAMPIHWLDNFLVEMDSGYDIVIGSRELAGAKRTNEPAYRHIRGRVFNWIVRLLAVRGFQDTQCGYKLFKLEAVLDLFSLQRSTGFGFDVEILYLARKKGLRVLEMPIEWYHRRSSKVRPGSDAFLMLRDTLLVRWNDLRGAYGELSRRAG
jgi:glycosyltransferase involved in cell wall biosynthesis